MPSLEEAKNIAWAVFISLLTALVLACVCSSLPARADGILFFHSEKCGPCKAMAPLVWKYAEHNKIVWVDVDKRPDIAQQWGVTRVPTALAVSEHPFGRFEEGRLTGRCSEEAFGYLCMTNVGDELCWKVNQLFEVANGFPPLIF